MSILKALGSLVFVTSIVLTVYFTHAQDQNETDKRIATETLMLEDLTAGASNDKTLLQWAFRHADPEVQPTASRAVPPLREEAAHDIRDADVMEAAIATLVNRSSTLRERRSALDSLSQLVEELDNANEFPHMGGLTPLLQILNDEAELAGAAAKVLAVAASNNGAFTNELMSRHPEIISVLMTYLVMSSSATADAPKKCLFALAALARGNVTARKQFLKSGGLKSLNHVLSGGASTPPVLRRIALGFVADLAMEGFTDAGMFSQVSPLAVSVLRTVGSDDSDIVEKSLMALNALLAQDLTLVATLKAENIFVTLENLKKRHEYEHVMNELAALEKTFAVQYTQEL